MIRTSTKPLAWALPWNREVTFMLRPGDPIERGELEADLAELRAGRVYSFQLTEAFLGGVDILLADAPEDAARVREVSAAEDMLKPGEALPADERKLLDEAKAIVAEHHAPFRTLLAQASRRAELLPLLSFQRFCAAWQGPDLPEYRKGIDGLLVLETVKQVPPVMVTVAGHQAYEMLYSTGHEGNSALPLPSDKSPAPSPSDTPSKAGSSLTPKAKKSSGGKIRSSLSRAGASPSSTSGSTADA